MDAAPAGWSRAQLRTLSAAVGALSGESAEDANRHAALAAETLCAVTDPADLRQIHWALWALESGLLDRPGTRFSRRPLAEREAVLRAWSTSRLPQRRTVFQLIKRLSLFLAYADPGPDPGHPANPHWARIGYSPAARPPSPARPTVQPVVVDRSATAILELEADAVVVGSGAGGSVVAARLAAAGRSVLVVEAGPYRPEPEMSTLESEGYRDLYLDRGTTATADLAVTILAGSGVGGGTTVNWTTSFAPPDWLRGEWVAEHGLEGFDAPETDADIGRLRTELGLMPPTSVPPKDAVLLDGCRALGWEADLTERNAGPCTECGACSFGCGRGSKRSALRVHLAAAAASGARLLDEAPATRIQVVNGAAIGIEGVLRPSGRPYRARAGTVVIAAGALRTPGLLARSASPHPDIGRHLRLHPVVAVAAWHRRPIETWIGPSQAARSLEFWRPGPAEPDGIGPAHGGFIIESAPPHPGLSAAAQPWLGSAETERRMGELRSFGPLIAIVRDTGEGSVRARRSGRPLITYRLGAAGVSTARRGLVAMARIAHAAGASEIDSVATPPARWSAAADGQPAFGAFLRRLAETDMRPNRISLFSAHQMGTARAGSDPRDHPCDPCGRVRLDRRGRVLAGCYVADASLFPSASGVNPMVTVMTLAERTARAILADS